MLTGIYLVRHSIFTNYYSGNSIGDDGVIALASYLPKYSALERLYLMGNNIGDRGVMALVAALPMCSSIHTLDLQCTIISFFHQLYLL